MRRPAEFTAVSALARGCKPHRYPRAVEALRIGDGDPRLRKSSAGGAGCRDRCGSLTRRQRRSSRRRRGATSMDAALDQSQTQLAPELDDALPRRSRPLEAEPVAEATGRNAPADSSGNQRRSRSWPAYQRTWRPCAGRRVPRPSPRKTTAECGVALRGDRRPRRPCARRPQRSPAPPCRPPWPHSSRPPRSARQGNDFYSFWAQRKNGRRFPSYGDFDAKQIAELWPNTMLLSCGTSARQCQFHPGHAPDRRRRDGGGADEVNFTPMLTEWMLAIGREAVSAGKPVQDIETFQNPVGSLVLPDRRPAAGQRRDAGRSRPLQSGARLASPRRRSKIRAAGIGRPF